jgi:two-component system, cell cycle sensor histidine kinase and response regulator CckA
VGRLAGGVAHDFNNLLTIIRGNSDLLKDREGADAFHQRCVEQIQKASGRAVSMTRQLLAFSRMQVLQPRVITEASFGDAEGWQAFGPDGKCFGR